MRQAIRVSMLGARLFRDVIVRRLTLQDGMDLVGAVDTVRELATTLPMGPIDIVVVRVDAESDETAEIVGQVKDLLPETRVVVIDCRTDDFNAVRLIEAGASACLTEDDSFEALVETIRSVHAGRVSCSARTLAAVMRRIAELADPHEVASEPADRCEPEPLSPREIEVARLIPLANKQIARRLGIKPKTVKHHVGSILRKLHVRRRRDVIGRV